MEKYNKKNIVLPDVLYSMIEKDIVNLYLELELTVPINPEDIARRLGYIVRRMSEIEDKKEAKKLRFDSKGCKRYGCSFYDPTISTSVIWINDVDSYSNERDGFTIMHEIGHIRLGHKEESDLADKMANHYAGYSLVPSPLFELLGCNSMDDIVDTFGVSDECAFICYKRCENWVNFFRYKKYYERKLRDYYKSILD